MNKFLKNKKGYRVVAAALTLSILSGAALAYKMNSSAETKTLTAQERLLAKRNEVHASLRMNNSASENEMVRAIITLKADSVADTADVSNYTSKLKSKEEKLIDKQESLIKKVEKITGNKVINQSAYLVNSFSINATRKQMKKIAKLDGIDTVYEAAEYKTCMNTAVKEGNAEAQWNDDDYGYTGEGVVVAVLDTGVNYKHQDMVLDEGVQNKFTKKEWEEKIKLLGYGKYFSEKVPFGYDYTTGKNDCVSSNNYHGYHVSGIVAGNNDNIQGVAPNAQVIGIKVLNDFGGGMTDDIVKGIEDAVKLGADVINMSLGMDKAVVSNEDYMQVALDNAAKEGVICCVSAGNSGTSAGYGGDTNQIGMEDTAMVGTPAVAKSCLAVASAQNVAFKRDLTIKAQVDNSELMFNAYDATGYGFDIADAKLVDVGIGVNEDCKLTMSPKKLKGNVAVVTSGTSSINEKVYYLSKAGVKGIIYVNDDEAEKENNIDIYDWENVPVIVVNKTEGHILKNNNKKSFKTIDVIENGEVSQDVTMSYFTSWGPTNELSIKPEITAPGGEIKAAFDGTDKYSILSGTSMASPFVAGSQAVMLNAIKERGLKLEGEELSKFMKNSLMNTADAVVNKKTGNYYSVRQQGSGMVDVHGAVDNNVLVTYNGEAKVELGEVTGTKDVALTFTNYGNVDASYSTDTIQLYTDYTVKDDNEEDDVDTSEYGIKPVSNSVITFDKTKFTVPAGGSITVNARIAISSAFENNKYIEGFMEFKGEGVQDIGLPVLGFYGDFDAEPIFDKSVYDDGESFISSKLDGYESGTGLYDGTYDGGMGELLGEKLSKDVLLNSEPQKNSSFNKLSNSIKKNSKIGTKSDAKDLFKDIKKKAVDVSIGDTKELVLLNQTSKAYYKIKLDEKEACVVKANEDIYPLITVYNDDFKVVTSNYEGYMFGMYTDTQINSEKDGTYYVEVSSLSQAVGKYNVSFAEAEYQENTEIEEDWDDEGEVSVERKNVKLDKTYKMKTDQYVGVYEAKEDGYITVDINTDEYASVSIYDEADYDEAWEEVEEYIWETTDYGCVSKEIKVTAGHRYVIEVNSQVELEGNSKLGTLKLTKTNGNNHSVLRSEYDENMVAFSPNSDEVIDGVTPGVLALRNAREVNVYVLDENKNRIRTISNVPHVQRMTYAEFMPGMLSSDISNLYLSESAYWDGKVYNSQTGKYEVAKEGNYYIQIEAKRSETSEPQIITMPVKLDLTAPKINNIKTIERDGECYVTFEVKDNNHLGNHFYVDIEGSDEWLTISKKYVETTEVADNTYELKVGKSLENKTVTLMVEDMAGNQTTETICDDYVYIEPDGDEFEDDEYDIEMDETEYYALCEGVSTEIDFLAEEVLLSSECDEINIEGMINKGYVLSINGNKVVGNCDNEYFDEYIEVASGAKSYELELVVTKDGTEIFRKNITAKLDNRAPEVIALPNESFEKLNNFTSDAETIALLKQDVKFPLSFQVKVEDENLDDGSSLFVSKDTMDEDSEIELFSKMQKAVLNEEGLDEEIYEEDARDGIKVEYNGENVYTITLESVEFLKGLSLEASDKVDNCRYTTMNIYTAEEKSEFDEIHACYASTIEFEAEEEVLTKDMLNADGTYTVKGRVGEIPQELRLNDEVVKVDPITKTFAHNVKVNYGLTRIVATGKLYNGEDVPAFMGTSLFMDDAKIKLDKLPKADANGEYNVTSEAFNLKGVVSSYANAKIIKVNGNVLYGAGDMAFGKDKPLEKKFDYNIKLVKGKNIITVEAITSLGTEVSEKIVVNYK